MSDLEISVVVPTIGRADALARCLQALVGNSPGPAEIVVVDQSGGLEIARVVDEHRERFPALRHVPMHRRGLSAARNAGARAARGNLLAFTDDDCVPDVQWLSELLSSFSSDARLAAVTGPMLPLGREAEGVAVSSRTGTTRREFAGRTLPWVVGTGGNTALRREWFDRLEGYDERLGAGTSGMAGEDLDLFRRLLQSGGRVLYSPTAVCRHERKPRAEHRARRSSYGVGAGAALGRWLRDGDAFALVALMRWLSLRMRLAGAERRRSALHDELRVVAATAKGLVYGLRLSRWGRQM